MTSVLTSDELGTVVSAAVAAPSILNTQPWRFHAHDDVIDVWADPGRALRHLDPQGRELLMSCGAATLNLRVALAAVGRTATCRVLPVADQPSLVARVQVGGPHRTTGAERRLWDAIPARRATREPFVDADVPEAILERLREAARLEGARVDEPPSWHRAALAGLVRDASRRQKDNQDVVEDIRSWTGDRAPAGAGVSVQQYGPRAMDPTALVRDFSMGARVTGRVAASFEQEGLLLVLLTDHDGPADRVRAGQALERVWLEATADGVAMTLLTQPTEVPELRPWLRDPTSPWASPQALLRLGHGPTPPPTQRRPVEDVLDVD
jgi:hypothetical protein